MSQAGSVTGGEGGEKIVLDRRQSSGSLIGQAKRMAYEARDAEEQGEDNNYTVSGCVLGGGKAAWGVAPSSCAHGRDSTASRATWTT